MNQPIDMKEFKKRAWHDRVEAYAKTFSDSMKQAFIDQRSLAKSSRVEFKMGPEEGLEFQLYEINVFFDYLISTAISIICFSANDGEEVEEAVVKQVREKFRIIREIKAQKEKENQ